MPCGKAMKQDHPDIVTIRKPDHRLHRPLEPRITIEQAGAITPSDPEANDVACETAEPADHDQFAQAESPGMGRIAGEQRQKQAMRSRIGKHEAVGRIAVLADEVQERCQIRRKQQCRSTQLVRVNVPQTSGFSFDASTPWMDKKADGGASNCFTPNRVRTLSAL